MGNAVLSHWDIERGHTSTIVNAARYTRDKQRHTYLALGVLHKQLLHFSLEIPIAYEFNALFFSFFVQD